MSAQHTQPASGRGVSNLQILKLLNVMVTSFFIYGGGGGGGGGGGNWGTGEVVV